MGSDIAPRVPGLNPTDLGQRFRSRLRIALVVVLTLSALAEAKASTLIPLATPKGMELLSTSRATADYGPLAQEFLTQANLAYCGVASSVMVLNSLQIPAPVVPGYGTYRFWTQENLWSGINPQSVIPAEQVKRQGMTLSELAALLQGHGLKVKQVHGDTLSLASLRQHLIENLKNPSDRVLINYDRQALHQKGGGHISPVAAYHAESDQVLILDVARYRYPTVWVPLRDLWQALRSIDTSSGKSRGMLLISR